MPWHAPASAPPSPTPPPASATPPAANTRPPTRLPAGFVSTDHLPRYRPEFTREGSIKRLAAAAPPTTPTSPTASPSPSPATQPAPPPATAPATAVSKAPDQSASPALLKVVRRALEASTTRLDALAARVDAIEARLAAHEARSERATDTAPSTEARHDDPPCAPPAEGDAHAPAASSSATSPSTTPSPSPSPSTFAAADGHAFAHVLAPLLADASSEELHQALLLVAQHNATTGQRTLDLAARIGAVEAICGYVERGAHPDTPSAAPDEPEAPKRQAHRR